MKSLLSIVVIALSMALPASAKQLFDGMSPYYTYLTESAIASEPQLSQKLKGAKSIEVVMFLGEPNADEIGKITQIIDNQKLDLINVTSNGESDIKAYGKPKGNKIKQLILTSVTPIGMVVVYIDGTIETSLKEIMESFKVETRTTITTTEEDETDSDDEETDSDDEE
ncbi:MAG: DUF4252 domain-containing protein [Muribaculaceae bacterium]|nr:DUF4252 domain-containing protein [Muribaculaceae bacterium]